MCCSKIVPANLCEGAWMAIFFMVAVLAQDYLAIRDEETQC